MNPHRWRDNIHIHIDKKRTRRTIVNETPKRWIWFMPKNTIILLILEEQNRPSKIAENLLRANDERTTNKHSNQWTSGNIKTLVETAKPDWEADSQQAVQLTLLNQRQTQTEMTAKTKTNRPSDAQGARVLQQALRKST